MAKQVITKIPLDESEPDRVVTDWLATHHITAKDVRAYTIERRIGDVEVMTLEILTSDVDEMPPEPVIKFDKDITPEEMQEFKRAWQEAVDQANLNGLRP